MARTGLVELEKMSDEELDKLGEEFAKLRAEANGRKERGTNCPPRGKSSK